MINLKPYTGDPFSFHKDVVSRKKAKKGDPDYKKRLELLNPTIEPQYKVYKGHFDARTLQLLTPSSLAVGAKEDLLTLYLYGSKKMQDLKIQVTTREDNRKIHTCQNCTINEVNSLDHLIPKDAFPAFVVNPLNLFPSCTKCNGHKSVNWRSGGAMLFLNLYLDTLPKVQYLFVSLTVDKDAVGVEFSLANVNGIDPDLFNVLESHYQRLHLFKRFREASDSIISEMQNLIVAQRKNGFSNNVIKQVVIDKVEADREYFGCNHYKSILELELINSNEFIAMHCELPSLVH